MGRPRKVAEAPAMEEGIRFFGDVDLDDNNKVRSMLPAWYFEQHIVDLEESIERKKRALKHKMIRDDLIMRTEAEIKAESEKLTEIRNSRPNLSGASKDRCYAAYKELAEQIKESLPTRKEDKLGLVSPHQELKRMKQKHIKIDSDIAAACGVKALNGKVSGDEAARCYKIIGKALGENTNVERLRRDGDSEAFRSMHDLTQAILQGRRIEGAV